MITTYYVLVNNRIDSIRVKPTNEYHTYSMYYRDNYVFVNAKRDKLSKHGILLDIEHIYKTKNDYHLRHSALNNVVGFTLNFLNELKEYGITYKELEDRIESAKHYSERKNNVEQYRQDNKQVCRGYVVG